MTQNKKRKITASLNEEQFADFEMLMAEDKQDNISFYFAYLINQEVKRRAELKEKRSPGRPPKKEDEDVYYPAPYEGGAPYKLVDLKAYYDFRKQPLPDPLPRPLTKEELAKWDL